MIFGLEPERVRRDSSSEHRQPSIASRRTRGAIVRLPPKPPKAPRIGVGDAVRGGEDGGGEENGGRPPPFPERLRTRSLASSERSRAGWFLLGGCSGNRETAASRVRGAPGRHRPGPDRYTPGVPCRVEAAREQGFSLGGPAIARPGRVVRPVRRPSDRQNPRRHSGGDPREICNQVPSRPARDFSILMDGGRQPGVVAWRAPSSVGRLADPAERRPRPLFVVRGAPSGVGEAARRVTGHIPSLVGAPHATAEARSRLANPARPG
jgi:hypothetical protein